MNMDWRNLDSLRQGWALGAKVSKVLDDAEEQMPDTLAGRWFVPLLVVCGCLIVCGMLVGMLLGDLMEVEDADDKPVEAPVQPVTLEDILSGVKAVGERVSKLEAPPAPPAAGGNDGP